MATQPRFNNDGNWVAGFNYGADKVTYPFLNYPTKDSTTKIYESTRAFLPANYTPQAALATYSGNPNAYLVEEGDMSIDEMARARQTVKYAMIPTNQVQFVSRSITRPNPRNTYVNTTGQSASPVTVQLYNGGVGLSVADDGSYIGNCLVSGIYKQLYGPTSVATFDGTFNVGVADTSTYNTSNSFSIYDSAAKKLIIYRIGEWGIVNSTAVNVSGGLSSGIKYAAPFLRTYAPGTLVQQLRQTEAFYLPNVTPGITQPNQIPVPTPIISDIDYFSAISGNTGTTYVTYDYDGPVVWKGPIYEVKRWDMQVSTM